MKTKYNDLRTQVMQALNMKTYETETLRRVYDNDEGHYLTVCPSPEGFDGNICVMAEQTEIEYWGPVRLDLPKEFMVLLARAILAAADEV